MHIQTKDKVLTKQVFDRLKQNKEAIEASIDLGPGQEWHWFRHDRHTFSSINIRRAGTIDAPQEQLEETRAWMHDMLPRLKGVLDPRVESILKEREGKADG